MTSSPPSTRVPSSPGGRYRYQVCPCWFPHPAAPMLVGFRTQLLPPPTPPWIDTPPEKPATMLPLLCCYREVDVSLKEVDKIFENSTSAAASSRRCPCCVPRRARGLSEKIEHSFLQFLSLLFERNVARTPPPIIGVANALFLLFSVRGRLLLCPGFENYIISTRRIIDFGRQLAVDIIIVIVVPVDSAVHCAVVFGILRRAGRRQQHGAGRMGRVDVGRLAGFTPCRDFQSMRISNLLLLLLRRRSLDQKICRHPRR